MRKKQSLIERMQESRVRVDGHGTGSEWTGTEACEMNGAGRTVAVSPPDDITAMVRFCLAQLGRIAPLAGRIAPLATSVTVGTSDRVHGVHFVFEPTT